MPETIRCQTLLEVAFATERLIKGKKKRVKKGRPFSSGNSSQFFFFLIHPCQQHIFKL